MVTTFSVQLTGLGAILGFTFVSALVVWFIIKMIFGIRVSEEEELAGLDSSEVGITAYPEFNK